jgi:hypothetical protein
MEEGETWKILGCANNLAPPTVVTIMKNAETTKQSSQLEVSENDSVMLIRTIIVKSVIEAIAVINKRCSNDPQLGAELSHQERN